MKHGLWPVMTVVCLALTGGWAKAVEPTVTTAQATYNANNQTWTIAADGTFPQLAGNPTMLISEVQARWVLPGKNGNPDMVISVEPVTGSGTAANGNPTGTFSGSKTGATCSTQGAKLEVRVKIRGKPAGAPAITDLTTYSAWKRE